MQNPIQFDTLDADPTISLYRKFYFLVCEFKKEIIRRKKTNVGTGFDFSKNEIIN